MHTDSQNMNLSDARRSRGTHSGGSKNPRRMTRHTRRKQRGGTALLVCLFVMAAVSAVVVKTLEVQTLELTILRNSQNYERGNYLAGAAVHHALSVLERRPSWTGTIPKTFLPVGGGGDYYYATVKSISGGNVQITAYGVTQGIQRTLIVTVDPGG